MIMDNLLKIEPQTLCFPYELNKEVSSTIRLFNMTRKDVAFKVMTTNPEKKYGVVPNWGIVEPGSSLDIIVTMRGPMTLPPEQKCRDKFKIRSVFASRDATTENEIRKLLDKKDIGVQECKLGVVYTFPRHVPSPVAEESASSSIALRAEYTNSSDTKLLRSFEQFSFP